MAIPSIPQNFIVQQANRQVLASWDLSAGATSYVVQRSTDQTSYSTIATVTATSYLDSAVTVGTQYWYQVSASNTNGSSSYTNPLVVIPAPTGEMSLAELRLRAQQRADRVNSNFITKEEWNNYINQSYFELYDLLITSYEDYFVATPAQFQTNGSQYQYPLPDGATTFTNGISGTGTFTAPPFYKLMGVDLSLNTTNNNGWVTINKFNFIDRNRFVYPNTASTIYGVFNLQYRILGTNIEFIPTPTANQPIRIWYIPRLTELLQDTDITVAGISGWTEYIIVDAAIKALQKEESDVSVLLAQKQMLIKRIEDTSVNRDAGQADRISDTRGQANPWGFNGPTDGFKGGW